MDNEGFVAMIRDPQAKRVIYELLKRVDKLEQENSKNNTFDFPKKGGEMLRELGFKSKHKYTGTHD
jgi:hypothetical protein